MEHMHSQNNKINKDLLITWLALVYYDCIGITLSNINVFPLFHIKFWYAVLYEDYVTKMLISIEDVPEIFWIIGVNFII